ncbi:LCP family protein [Luteimicrobium subarcticum]|uniref:LytR family transcriptional attenuator n=1 Tax=Luteimicrobium subarcticum TaxID=620910 RepID=A0A2M8WTG2_9MICO|nr:LCP family protein [Luteimicrobium subarcticum]PJI94237.1 LytR family transcriptional attenuator [Luteimicrobium subarcticum]
MNQDVSPPPPSFTPQGHSAARPSSDDVITVGPDGATSAGAAPRPPAPPAPPRVTRQSSQGISVQSAQPPSFAPHGSSRTVQRAARGTTSTRPPQRTEPAAPGGTPDAGAAGPGRIRIRKGRVAGIVAVVVVAALVAWPIGLAVWANGKLQHVDALSGSAGTTGTTYLLAGSDSRADGVVKDHTTGARTDSIMVLHVPDSGPTALISIPRDSYVPIPGHGSNKVNAAYSLGGAPLLVKTVEQLTGMHVDHYVEIGFGGVEDVVDAVGGVHLCYDRSVQDKKSKLTWTKGCHDVDGKTALAFSRMRYSDPLGDFGRAQRQQQVIGALSAKVKNPALLFQPTRQVGLLDAGTGVLTVDESMNVLDLAHLAIAFKNAEGKDGVTGLPPVSDPDYRPGGVGSSVRLDPDKTPTFFAQVADGSLEPGSYGTG